MTDYVDRCLCGYFVTKKELDSGECPECNKNICNLGDAWTDWEEQQIAEAVTGKATEPITTQPITSVNSPNTGGIQRY